MENDEQAARLRRRFVRGGLWAFALRGSSQLLTMVRLVILARLLAPADFGMVGIALLIIAILEAFSQTGLAPALIQRRGGIAEHLDTAWTVSLVRGLVLFTILYLTAPHSALFFKIPEASLVIRLIGLSLLFNGLSNIGIVHFHRELDFKRQFIHQLCGTITDFLVAVTVALLYRNVWALVAGVLAGDLVRLVVSYLIHPYRPKLRLHLARLRELLGFGKWISGSTVLAFIGSTVDSLAVGRLLGPAALGHYRVAFQISSVPFSEVAQVVGRTAFPAYAKVQDNGALLRRFYLKIMKLTGMVYLPAAACVVLFAHEFTAAILGDQWLPMVPALRILAVMGLFKSVIAGGGPLFVGSGRPHYEFRIQLARCAFMVLLIYPATLRWGLEGAACCAAASLALPLLLWWRYSTRLTGIAWTRFPRIYIPAVCATVSLTAAVYGSFALVLPSRHALIPAVLAILLALALGVTAYLATIALWQRFDRSFGILDDVKYVFGAVKGGEVADKP